ncbi:MAG: hypothetical protein MI924_27835 [Chloroflexales bacterium]|nr:hypothetical protein [Chloroflexales bacterium]
MHVSFSRLRTRLLIITLVALLAGANLGLALWPQFAAASFPGQNGKIAFGLYQYSGGGYGSSYRSIGIYTMNPDGSGVQQLHATGKYPAWSADGAKLTFVDGGNVLVMNADGSNVRTIHRGNSPRRPFWSPDGGWIAFTGYEQNAQGGYESIYAINTDGSGLRRLQTFSSDISINGAAWSPDGGRIAYALLDYTGTDYLGSLWVMNVDGSNAQQLLAAPGKDFEAPDWTPDGQSIVYVDDGDLIRAIDVTSQNQRVIVPQASGSGWYVDNPAVSPDGRHVVVYHKKGLYTYTMDGNLVSSYTPNGRNKANYPSWQPVQNGTPPPPPPAPTDVPPPPPATDVPPPPTTVIPTGPRITDIRGVQDGQTIRGRVVIEAQVTGTDIAQVTFTFAGPQSATWTEQRAPYFLGGDRNGQPLGWDTKQLPNGAYTLTVTATDRANQSDSRVIRLQINNEREEDN